MLETSPRVLGIVPDVMQIAFGDDPKRTDRCERAALGTVDLVHAIAFPDRPPLTSARQVEVFNEDVSPVTIDIPIVFAPCTAAPGFANPQAGSVANVTWVVSVHSSPGRSTCSWIAPASDRSMGKAVGTGQTTFGCVRVESGIVSCCRCPLRSLEER